MFGSYLYEQSAAQYTNRILIIDCDGLGDRIQLEKVFEDHGFIVLPYIDDLYFRVEQHDKLSCESEKYAVIVKPSQYIPYDIYHEFTPFKLTYAKLFPKLSAAVLKNRNDINLDLLVMAYKNCFSDLSVSQLTEQFIQRKVYSRENIQIYLDIAVKKMSEKCSTASSYQDWFAIAEDKAAIDVMATEYDVSADTDRFHALFVDFIESNFGKLSSKIDRATPVTVSRAMEYIKDHSDKFVIIVMDGMSEFDWEIISRSFKGLVYDKSNIFAMIPTTTSISRQCLLSNKYPSQLMEPWKQSKEKQEFFDCANGLGFTNEQIDYVRGYEVSFSSFVKCGAVIINDVDDMVHGQQQGRIGMFNDISVLAKQGQLASLTKRLHNAGYDVYITADHGNTPCVGMGKLMKTGVEIETKSRRMLVLKDFADKDKLLEQYSLIDYPKYYLSKEFDYLICGVGCSFDAKGEAVMSHGGITIDEVIVPFIKVKAVDNNG